MRLFFAFLISFNCSQFTWAASTDQDFKSINQLMVNNGCAEENVKSDRVRLSAKTTEASDLLVFCASDCGAHQCSYSIYLHSKDQYRYYGDFFGHYEILKTKHHNYYDLKVESKSAEGHVVSKTIQIKGSVYQ